MTERVLHLIRHASTKLNNDDIRVDRIRGWTNLPLSKEGLKQAEVLAREISHDPPDVLLCSDLKRAVQTAEVIAHVLGMKLENPLKAFRPWNVGDYAGEVVQQAMPILLRYAIKTPEKPMPGGESFNAFRNRFLDGLRKAFFKHEGEIGIVTHHRSERLVKSWAKAGFRDDGTIDVDEFKKRGAPTGNCGLVRIPAEHLFKSMPAFGDGREELWQEWVSD